MTSSLEGEGGGSTKRWHDDTGWGGKGTDDKIPSFYWNSSRVHEFKSDDVIYEQPLILSPVNIIPTHPTTIVCMYIRTHRAQKVYWPNAMCRKFKESPAQQAHNTLEHGIGSIMQCHASISTCQHSHLQLGLAFPLHLFHLLPPYQGTGML